MQRSNIFHQSYTPRAGVQRVRPSLVNPQGDVERVWLCGFVCAHAEPYPCDVDDSREVCAEGGEGSVRLELVLALFKALLKRLVALFALVFYWLRFGVVGVGEGVVRRGLALSGLLAAAGVDEVHDVLPLQLAVAMAVASSLRCLLLLLLPPPIRALLSDVLLPLHQRVNPILHLVFDVLREA